MLKKIIAIKNVGRFINSAAGGNTQLAKHTYILGSNGFGKTTTCAILRSLATGDPSHILGRRTLGAMDRPAVELLFEDGVRRFDGSAWSTPYPALAIFDGVFVADNIHSGEVVDTEHKRNLYRVIIGQGGVALAEEDAALAAASRAKTSDITSCGRTIQSHIPTGIRLDAFLGFEFDPDIDARIAAQAQAVAAAREANTLRQRAGLLEFTHTFPPANFARLLGATISEVAEDAEAQLRAHLDRHQMPSGSDWIAEGLQHTQDDECPFCGQDIRGLPLIASYRAIFSERYGALRTAISDATSLLDRQLDELETLALLVEQNRGGFDFWSRYCLIEPPALALVADVQAAAKRMLRAAQSLLEHKAGNPLEAVAESFAFTEALAEHEAAQVRLSSLNAGIRSANSVIAARKASADATHLQPAEDELARLKAIKTRHSEPIRTLCDNYAQHVSEKSELEARKAEVRMRLDEHTQSVVVPYERRINELLDQFNAGFRIGQTRHSFPSGIASSNYQLVINSVAVDVGGPKTPADQPSFKNTLSSGDRTTLALAFFLASIERAADLATKVIVFDDPFNSQDAFRRNQTAHEIARIGRHAAQIVVFSHDAVFLKQLWNKSATDRVSLAIMDQRALGSKISAIDLERACQGRTANDIDDLQSFLTTGAGALVDLVRKMRTVLEAYLRTTYSGYFLDNEWLGEMVGKIRDSGSTHPAFVLYDDLDQINSYTSPYHHGENMQDATGDQLDSQELTGFARRTLRIVNALQA